MRSRVGIGAALLAGLIAIGAVLYWLGTRPTPGSDRVDLETGPDAAILSDAHEPAPRSNPAPIAEEVKRAEPAGKPEGWRGIVREGERPLVGARVRLVRYLRRSEAQRALQEGRDPLTVLHQEVFTSAEGTFTLAPTEEEASLRIVSAKGCVAGVALPPSELRSESAGEWVIDLADYHTVEIRIQNGAGDGLPDLLVLWIPFKGEVLDARTDPEGTVRFAAPALSDMSAAIALGSDRLIPLDYGDLLRGDRRFVHELELGSLVFHLRDERGEPCRDAWLRASVSRRREVGDRSHLEAVPIPGMQLSGRADEAGRVAFPAVPVGLVFAVTAGATGCDVFRRQASSLDEMLGEVRASAETSVTLNLSSGAALEARLLDAITRAPLPGVGLTLRSRSAPEDTIAARAVTDAEGRFRARVPREPLYLELRDAGFLPFAILDLERSLSLAKEAKSRRIPYGDWNWIAPAEVEPSSAEPWRVEIDVPVRPRLGGKVRTKDGAAVAGALVIASLDREGIECRASARSGPDGTFRIEGLYFPGPYDLRVEAAGFGAFQFVEHLYPKFQRDDLDLCIAPLQQISGRVRDEEGRPIAGARVRLQIEHSDEVESITDPEGRFAAQAPSPPQRVQIDAEGYCAYDSSLHRPRPQESDPVYTLVRLVTLRGIVEDESNHRIQGATVTSVEHWDESLRFRATRASTSAEGTFEMQLPDRGASLSVQAEGFRDAELSIERSALHAPVSIRMDRGGVLTGAVLRPDGKGLSGATVVARDPATEGVFEGTSDAGGVFEIAGLPRGVVAVEVLLYPESFPGWELYSAPDLMRVDSNAKGIELRLTEGASVSGHLSWSAPFRRSFAPDDVPSLTYVTIFAIDSAGLPAGHMTQPSEDGSFTIRCLRLGMPVRLEVQASNHGGRDLLAGPFDVGKQDISIEIDEGKELRIEITYPEEDGDVPELEALVELSSSTTPALSLLTAAPHEQDSDGFRFDGLPDVPLRVIVRSKADPTRRIVREGVIPGDGEEPLGIEWRE